MPIYAYRCEECGFAKDVLQKMSDDPLTVCLECGKSSFKKQVTAAGFQLKGSGWYVTDFRDGKGGAGANSVAPAESSSGPTDGSAGTSANASGTTSNDAAPASSAAASPAPATPSASSDTKAA